MKVCEICGVEACIEDETTPCPQCGRMRCQNCDMGTGSVCIDCDVVGPVD